MVAARGWEGGEGEFWFDETFSVWDDEKVLDMNRTLKNS